MATAIPPKAPKVIGGFELLSRIGQGGMGSVFKARQISLDRVVAVKILPPSIAQRDAVFVERFTREARTSAKLNHPNIVQAIEVGQDPASGLHYFAMEFIDGPTVKQLLKEQRVIDERRALQLMRGVAEALICAHRAGIVHRDVKPDNILLNSDGEPKLADLGLARFVLDSSLDEATAGTALNPAASADLTQAGSTVGTPGYMAPEQVRGESDQIDARTDLYAMGATLFHMLTGRAPYTNESARVVMEMHLNAPVPNAQNVNPHISAGASKLIYKLMQKEKAQRVQTAEKLAQELERLLQTGGREKTTARRTPVDIVPASRPKDGRKSERREAAAEPPPPKPVLLYVGLGAAAVGVLALILILSGGPNRPPDASAAANPLEKRDSERAQPVPPAPPPAPERRDPVPSPPDEAPTPAVIQPVRPIAAPPPWPALDKAIQASNEKPEEYAALLELFLAAEKGAPSELIGTIRHERGKIERNQGKAFRALFEDLHAKAQGKAAQQDYVGAAGLLQEAALPAGLLNETARQDLAKARAELEAAALANFIKGAEIDLKKEIETAGMNVPRLEAAKTRIEAVGKQQGLKPVLERLNALSAGIEQRMQQVKGEQGRAQDAAFKAIFEQAQQFALGGSFKDATNLLAKSRSDKMLIERHGARLDMLVRDLGAAQLHLQKAGDALNGKIQSEEIMTLRPSGRTTTGKIVRKDGEHYVMEDKQGQAHDVEVSKLDGEEVVALAGLKPESSERRYAAGVYLFWQGKLARAMETLAQLKNCSQASDAQFYIGWMNEKLATELIARTRELYREVQGNAKLSAADKEARRREVLGLIQRLDSEFATTEAYRALHLKK